MTTTLNIREFDLNMLSPNSNNFKDRKNRNGCKIVCIGKPKSGKSTTILAILNHVKNIIPVCMIQSGSEEYNHTFSKKIPSAYIYNSYNGL